MQTLTPENEKVLLLRTSEGDESAFAILFNHYYTFLAPFIGRFSLSDSDIEEALQETFIRVWLYRDKLGDVENFKAWIIRVASREGLNILRKNLRNSKKLAGAGQQYEGNSPEITPYDLTHLSEISRLVQQAVHQMPPQRKLIYQMSRNEGMKPAEIARALSLSVSTVKNVLTTCLKEIREFLAAAGHPLLLMYIFLKIF